MSAGAASVPVPEAKPHACPRDAGRSTDTRSRDAQHQADEGFAGMLTAIADDRAGPPGPPGDAPETTARTATAEGQEGESDSPAPTGIEQALVALAAVVTAAPGETLEAVPTPQVPVPQQGPRTAATPSDPKVAPQAEPAQAASTLPGAASPSAEAATQQLAAQAQESATPGLVAPRGEGQRRLDGKPSSTPHRGTPVQSARSAAADAAVEASGAEAETPEVLSPPVTRTPVTEAASPAPIAELPGAARHVRPTTHPQTGHGEERGGTAAASATAAGPTAKEAPSSAAPAHEAPQATATEPSQAEQPASQPATPVGGARQVDPGTKAAATAPHGRTQLHELVARVRETIRFTVREERTEARITLHPAELGEVRIRISYGPGGISASIVADSSRAAQTLAQSTPELRRTLEEHGMTLQSVDVQIGGDGAQLGSENGPGSAAAGSDGDARRESTGDTTADDDDDLTDPEPSRDAPLGAYVDVLA